MRRYWLVGRGKFGATATLAGHQEGPVGLEGTLIARDGWQMLELVPGSVQRLSETVTAPPVVNGSRRHVRLHGEIVDSKCYLGVMNPGADAAHRDCAVRCLSGGVPPMFAYRGAEGSMHLAWLLGPGMAVPDAALRRLAGTRVDLAGELVTVGDDEVFVVEAP